jgi:exodeoxyribonuclease VII large subunit
LTNSENAWGVDSTDNIPEYSVSELSGALKKTVEDRFGFVRVKAELSGVKIVSSGHCYFALKDDNAVLDGVMWRGNVSRLNFRPEDGLEVVCSGKITTYAARSKYQMVVDSMEPAGVGALMALLEERKRKLSSEGLFDQARKKAIPFLPKHIGVVSSPTGAVIRDILHRLEDRFQVRVTLWPVKVQGEGAAEEVARAIEGFNRFEGDDRPQTLIVARGGGSIEDLWAFNEEIVVRAAAASNIPLISAVGHETDTTLIDYASDRRAPTPTAAAEMAVPVKEDLKYTLLDFERRLSGLKQRMIGERRISLTALARALPTPRDILGMATQRTDDLAGRLPLALNAAIQRKSLALSKYTGQLNLGTILTRIKGARERTDVFADRLLPAMQRQMDTRQERLSSSGRILESLSYKNVLERGYALVTNDKGSIVTRAKDMGTGDRGELQFADGTHSFIVDGESALGAKPPVKKTEKKTAPRKKNTNTGQGSLF